MPKATPATLRLVRVVWEDISVIDEGTWVHREGVKPHAAMVFDTVGWLLEMTPEFLIITSCVGTTLMAPRERIPLGVVKQITEFPPGTGTAVKFPKKRKPACPRPPKD